MVGYTKFSEDLLEQLKDPDFICNYINAAISENDPEFLLVALADVIKALGIGEIAKNADLSRQTVYKIAGENANPTFRTINDVLKSLGLKLVVAKDSDDDETSRAS